MTDAASYFAADAESQATDKGKFVAWSDLDPIEIVTGLQFQPVLGTNVMVNFVHFDPNTEAPRHWHEEEQISFVIEGEFEFEIGDEKRMVRRGEAIVIPPNVPHAARTFDSSCLEIDVFHPPRKGLLDAMGNTPTPTD
jgi:quercetin dioxygenase-like cupin family protein